MFTFGGGNYGQLGHNNTHTETNPLKVFEFMGSEVSMIACGRLVWGFCGVGVIGGSGGGVILVAVLGGWVVLG